MDKINILKFDNERKNKVYGPYSLNVALSMLKEGAGGLTRQELEKVLQDENISKFNSIDGVFSVANKMYIKNDIAQYINENYRNIIADKYDAEVELSDLNNLGAINNWVENKTLGQIKNILDQISGNLLLINTTAIDMEWAEKVRPDSVSGGFFNGNILASYIRGFSKYNCSYYEGDDALALGINLKQYDNNEFEFVAIQPKNIELDEYINSIDDDNLNGTLRKLEPLIEDPRDVEIEIPKFSFDYKLKPEILTSMGVTTLNHPDLSNMVPVTYELNLIHKTNIDFSENGLKAASATVIQVLCGSAMGFAQEKLKIVIDKPFLFVIREKNTNTIFFIGTVYEPILWENDKNNYREQY